jgi:hypothetical protein
MKLSEKKSSTFTPCPEYTGRAVCVDVTPLETKQTDYGPKEKFRLVFEVDLENERKERHCVWSSNFTASLNEKATLRKFLKQWLGRDLTAQELQEFDTESLIGKPAFLVVTHTTGDNGETYANIAACTPMKQGEPLAPSGKFTRKKDRKDKAPAAGGDQAQYRKAEQTSDGSGGRDDWMSTKVHVGKNAGVDLGDLDEEAVMSLVNKWLPVHAKAPKQTADDKRLAAALEKAVAAIKAAKEQPAEAAAPATTDY